MKKVSSLYFDSIALANKYFWRTVVISVDLHGVIIDSEKYNHSINTGASVTQAVEEAIYPQCIIPLQKMSIRKDLKLFLYTSTTEEIKEQIASALLDSYGIEFDYLNSVNLNSKPLKEGQDFSEKPYCDILLDNSAGFEPEEDWDILNKVVNEHFIIPIKHGDS